MQALTSPLGSDSPGIGQTEPDVVREACWPTNCLRERLYSLGWQRCERIFSSC
jgi:hypothetical protein